MCGCYRIDYESGTITVTHSDDFNQVMLNFACKQPHRSGLISHPNLSPKPLHIHIAFIQNRHLNITHVEDISQPVESMIPKPNSLIAPSHEDMNRTSSLLERQPNTIDIKESLPLEETIRWQTRSSSNQRKRTPSLNLWT